jgi:hypothetical protein
LKRDGGERCVADDVLLSEYRQRAMSCRFVLIDRRYEYGVIPCQTSKNETKMSPWVGNFETDIFHGFYIYYEKSSHMVFLVQTILNFTTGFWPKKGKFTKWPPQKCQDMRFCIKIRRNFI